MGAALPLISNKGFVSINGVIQEPPLNFDFNETIGDGDEGGEHRNRLDAGQAPTRTTTFAGWMLPLATQISQSQSFSLEILAERSTSKTSSSTACSGMSDVPLSSCVAAELSRSTDADTADSGFSDGRMFVLFFGLGR